MISRPTIRAYHLQHLHKQLILALQSGNFTSALSHLNDAIEKFAPYPYLHLFRAYLTALSYENNTTDKEAIERDLEIAQSLSANPAELHLVSRECYLCMHELDKAATEQKQLSGTSYFNSFNSSLNSLIDSLINRDPDMAFDLLKLRTRFDMSSDNLNHLKQIQRLFAAYPKPTEPVEDKEKHAKIYRTGVLVAAPKLIPNPTPSTQLIALDNLSTLFRVTTQFEDKVDIDNLAAVLCETILPDLKKIYPDLSAHELNKLALMVEFWIHDEPTITLSKELCDRLMLLMNSETIPPDEYDQTVAQFNQHFDKTEVRKGLSIVNDTITRYPNTLWAYLQRIGSYLTINGYKYKKNICDDLKIAHLICYIQDFTDRPNASWHISARNAATEFGQPFEAQYHHGQALQHLSDPKSRQETTQEFLNYCDTMVKALKLSSPRESYEFYKIIAMHTKNKSQQLRIAKIEALHKHMQTEEELLIESCKGMAFTLYPGFFGMTDAEVAQYNWKLQELQDLLYGTKHYNPPLTYHACTTAIETHVNLDTDVFKELSMRTSLVKNQNLLDSIMEFDALFNSFLSHLVTTHKIGQPLSKKNIAKIKRFHLQAAELLEQTDPTYTPPVVTKTLETRAEIEEHEVSTPKPTDKDNDKIAKNELSPPPTVANPMPETKNEEDYDDRPFTLVTHTKQKLPTPSSNRYQSWKPRSVAPKPNSIQLSDQNFPRLPAKPLKQPERKVESIMAPQPTTASPAITPTLKQSTSLVQQWMPRIDIPPVEKQQVDQSTQSEPPQLSLNKSILHNISPRESEELTRANQAINTLIFQNSYLNYVSLQHSLFQQTVILQLAAMGIPCNAPIIMSQEEYANSLVLLQQMQQEQKAPLPNDSAHSNSMRK